MILHFQPIYKLIFRPVWTYQIMVFFVKKHIIGILCSTGKTVLLTTELKCEEYSMVSNVFYAVTFQIGVALKTKSIASMAEDFPIEFAPSSLPSTTFNPFLNRIGGQIHPAP